LRIDACISFIAFPSFLTRIATECRVARRHICVILGVHTRLHLLIIHNARPEHLRCLRRVERCMRALKELLLMYEQSPRRLNTYFAWRSHCDWSCSHWRHSPSALQLLYLGLLSTNGHCSVASTNCVNYEEIGFSRDYLISCRV
jgi:hypothetical protein